MTLLHLSPNVITLRSLLHLRPNVITLKSLLHLRAVITFRSSTDVRIQNVRDFAQTKPDSEINAPFLSNEHGDPRFFFRYLLRTV